MSRRPDDYYREQHYDRRHSVKQESNGSQDDYKTASSLDRDDHRVKREYSSGHEVSSREVKREHLRDEYERSRSRECSHSSDGRSSHRQGKDSREGPRDRSGSSKSLGASDKYHRERRSRSSSDEQRSADEIRRQKTHKHHKHRTSLHSHKTHESRRSSRWDQREDKIVRDSKRSKLYRNDRQVAAVSPCPRSSRENINPGPSNDIEIVECSDNKLRTQKRRLEKKYTPIAPEVITVDLDTPSPPIPEIETANPSSTNPPMSQISLVSMENLAMPPVIKFDSEYMVPEDNVFTANHTEMPYSQYPAETFANNYRSQAENLPQASFVPEDPVEYHEEVERKPLAQIPSVKIAEVQHSESLPPAQATKRSYDIQAVCKSCGITFVHSCNNPPSTSSNDMFLEPGQVKTCKCGIIFLHTRNCQEAISKIYVPTQKETGLMKQVDRIHKYECHDCMFKFSIERIRHASHYFESLTRKDGTLREKGKKNVHDLHPMLKLVDEITRQRYPNEAPLVQKTHAEIRRCLICQCNQGCCVVYHECPPRPSIGHSDENFYKV